MLLACWSVKGGSGTTVVAASLALVIARREAHRVVVADLAGDAPAALGSPATTGPGISDWLAAGDEVAPDALGRLAVDVGGGVSVLPWGEAAPPGRASPACAARLLAALHAPALAPTVVIDAGRPDLHDFAAGVVSSSPSSLLVIRPCYLALRRAVAATVRATGVVVVDEPGRALTAGDVEDALGVPLVASVPCRPEIARVADAGMLAGRLPRPLASALRRAS